jgi:hypothetical protein
MLDANSTLGKDKRLREFVDKHELKDMQDRDPAPSTYIGASERRIDFMFGCHRTYSALSRQEGTLSYFEGPQSDHRGLYVNLNLFQIFGISITDQTMVGPTRRNLRVGNPELVENYLKSMHQYYASHQMQERIDHLHKTHHLLPRSHVRKLLTSWDNDQGRAMMASEATIAKPSKQYQWSPTLRNAGVIKRYWALRLREIQYVEDYQSTFDKWESHIQ